MSEQKAGALRGGRRLKIMRDAVNLIQTDWCELTGMSLTRLRNLELLRVKMNEDDYECVLRLFPEFSLWLVMQGPVSAEALRNSKNKFCRFVAAKFDEGVLKGELTKALR